MKFEFEDFKKSIQHLCEHASDLDYWHKHVIDTYMRQADFSQCVNLKWELSQAQHRLREVQSELYQMQDDAQGYKYKVRKMQKALIQLIPAPGTEEFLPQDVIQRLKDISDYKHNVTLFSKLCSELSI